MPQILIRAHKNPFTVADADTTYRQNLIGNNTGNLVFSQAVYRLLSAGRYRPRDLRAGQEPPRVINSRFDHVVIPLANAFRPSYIEHAGCAEHPDRATDHPGDRTGRRVTGFAGWRLQGCRPRQAGDDAIRPCCTESLTLDRGAR